MKAMSTCFLDNEKKVATIETKKKFRQNRTQFNLHRQNRRWLRIPAQENVFIELMYPMYLEFALHVERVILMYCSIVVFELVSINSESRRIWRKCVEDVEELRVPRKDKIIFAPGTPFYFYSASPRTHALF